MPSIEILSTVSPVISSLMNLVIPKMDKIIQDTKERKSVEDNFRKYISNLYETFRYIKPLGLRNEKKLLKDIYLPLTLRTRIEDKYLYEIVNGYNENFCDRFKKILIVDDAGMGKSTMTKLMCLDVIEKGTKIPIYIELRKLSQTKTIIDELVEQISPLSKNIKEEYLLKFIEDGDLIIFFDGYDEIASVDVKYVSEDLQKFISKAPNNIFIITSRPDHIEWLPTFQQFSIDKLKHEEAYKLLQKYDNGGTLSNALIKELKEQRNESINDFLENPLLVSLLFTAYDYQQTIPLSKSAFYEQVYNALFERHDTSKGGGYVHEKKSNLNKNNFSKILEYISFLCIINNENSYDEHRLILMIDKAKNKYSSFMTFESSDFFDDLIHAVPLFCFESGKYRWAHKSFQEYFAALHIARGMDCNGKNKILSAIYKSENINRYQNLLDLYYDIDTLGFNEYILKPFCEDYLTYIDENLQTINFDNIPIDLIQDRLDLLYQKEIKFAVIKSKNEHKRCIDTFEPKNDQKKYIVYHFKKNPAIHVIGCWNKQILFNLLYMKKNDLFLDHEAISRADLMNYFSQVNGGIFNEITIETGNGSIEEYSIYNNFLHTIILDFTIERGKLLSRFNKSAIESTLAKIKKDIDTQNGEVLDDILSKL